MRKLVGSDRQGDYLRISVAGKTDLTWGKLIYCQLKYIQIVGNWKTNTKTPVLCLLPCSTSLLHCRLFCLLLQLVKESGKLWSVHSSSSLLLPPSHTFPLFLHGSSTGCRKYLLNHGTSLPPSSLTLMLSLLFLIPLYIKYNFLKFFFSCLAFFCLFLYMLSHQCHALGWWAQLWPAASPLQNQLCLAKDSPSFSQRTLLQHPLPQQHPKPCLLKVNTYSL